MPIELHKVMIGVLFFACLIVPLALLAPQKEMSISTASDEAKKLFLEGRDNYELFELAPSAQYFDQAIEKAPTLLWLISIDSAPVSGVPKSSRNI